MDHTAADAGVAVGGDRDADAGAADEDAARDLLGVRTVAGTPADDDEGGATPRLTALDVEYLGDAAVGDEVEIESGSTGDLGIAQQARRGSTRLVRAASLWGRARRSTILGGPPGT